MRPEQAVASVGHEDMHLDGVPSPWDEVLGKMGISNKTQLKSLNPNKLFNDLGGMRKKLKLETPMPSLDDVKAWVS
jgi:lysyl-tRNA synthetase class 2